MAPFTSDDGNLYLPSFFLNRLGRGLPILLNISNISALFLKFPFFFLP
jgi:hypothetical protein